MSEHTTTTLATLGVTCRLFSKSLAQVRALFPTTVHYYPTGDIPLEILAQCDMLYADPVGLPRMSRRSRRRRACSTSSCAAPARTRRCDTPRGLHTIAIPQYVLDTALALYHRLPRQIVITKAEARWPSHADI
ncbi:hypothetical protein HDZ31DRAFT_69794, partial [Schizophyllum fasciatum]